MFYVATEPYVRRNWPDALISWTRFQSGRSRDPLVASHVLAGISTIAGVSVLVQAIQLAVNWLGPVQINTNGLTSLDSVAAFISNMLTWEARNLFLAIAFLLLVVLLRLLVRRLWIADVLGTVLFAAGFSANGANVYQRVLFGLMIALLFYSLLSVLRWFGLLAIVAGLVLVFVQYEVPPVFASWYAGRALVALVIPAAVSAWALWVILSSQHRHATDSPTM
jgi:hypothetical protein